VFKLALKSAWGATAVYDEFDVLMEQWKTETDLQSLAGLRRFLGVQSQEKMKISQTKLYTQKS
jgi:hypothetical protein